MESRIFSCFVLVLMAFAWDGIYSAGAGPPQSSSTCTTDYSGMPACNFDKSFCGILQSHSMDKWGLQWKRTEELKLTSGSGASLGTLQDWRPASLSRTRGSFVYLDMAGKPLGSKARLTGSISNPDVKAVCITMHYATVGKVPISVYNHMGDGSDPNHIIEIGGVYEDTGGKWHDKKFETCVMNMSKISFESEKGSFLSQVALDYLDITHSNMDCSTFDPECTTSHVGTPSCTFDKATAINIFCGVYKSQEVAGSSLRWKWTTELQPPGNMGTLHDWRPLGKEGQQGAFMYLDVSDEKASVGAKARLTGHISDPKVKAVCIEIKYATTTTTTANTTTATNASPPVIRIYNTPIQGGKDILVGTVEEDTKGVWKTARFKTCVGELSKISFESEKKSVTSQVALDYLDITHSNMDCSTFENTTSLPTSHKTTPYQTTTPKTTRHPTTTPKTTRHPTTTPKTTRHPTTTHKTTRHPTTHKTTRYPTTHKTTRHLTTHRTTQQPPETTQEAVRHDFYCDVTTVSVHIPVSLLPNSKLTLRDPYCVLHNNGTHYTLFFKFDECGTSVTHFHNVVLIQNQITVHKDLGHIQAPIEFDQDFTIPIKCTINRHVVIEGGMETVTRDPTKEEEDQTTSHMEYTMKEFKTESYFEEITDFPVKIPINREVFIELSPGGSSNPSLGIEIEECVATRTSDPKDPVSYTLLVNGCPASPAVHLVSSNTVTKRRFKLQAFHFSGQANNHNRVYFHCQIKYCLPYSCARPTCSNTNGTATASRGRRRRGVRSLKLAAGRRMWRTTGGGEQQSNNVNGDSGRQKRYNRHESSSFISIGPLSIVY